MKGKELRVKLADLELRPVRSDHGADDELKALAASWLKRSIHPILARRGPPVTVIDGHRRLAGLKLLGETEVGVFVLDGEVSDADALEITFTTAMHRADLNAYEKARVVRDFAALHPGITSKEIAAKFSCDPGMITRLSSLWRTPPEVQKAAQENKLSMNGWYQISQAKAEEQLGLFHAMMQSNVPASAVEAARKKGQKPARKSTRKPRSRPKQSRCVWQNAAGTKVTVTAKDGLDQQGVIDALTASLEAARKATEKTSASTPQ